MSLLQFFRIFNRNLNLFLLCSILLAVMVFYLTRNLKKEYETETEIFTGIASGLNLNNLGDTKVDYFSTNTEYDNLINIIKSRQTLQEVGYRLMVQHMMLDSINPRVLNAESWGVFRYYMPEELEEELLVPYSVEETVDNIQLYKRRNYEKQKVKWAFESDQSPYSFSALGSALRVYRVQNSDLIRITFTWSDPGVAQNVLLILNQVFTANVSDIKSGQSEDVIDYFREQVNASSERLDAAEQALQDFRVANRMINYQEETRSLALQKDKMEDEYQKEYARLEATKAIVNRLEQQLAKNNELVLLGNAILEKKKELIEVRAKIAELETYYNDVDLLAKLRKRGNKLEAEVSNEIMNRYEATRTIDGIPIQSVIMEWLDYNLQLVETQARLRVFADRRAYFEKEYSKYAQLGARAARLERQIEIEESTYLEVLYNLNQAIMRQRSQRISTGGLVVTVPPAYPLEPKKSKTMLLVLVAAVIGFVVPFVFVLLKEFIDSSIRTPERAEDLTKLELLGAYPDLTKRNEHKNVNFDWLHEKASGLLVQNLRMEAKTRNITDRKPKYVLVFSTRSGDGKQLVTHTMANELVSLNHRVMVLGPRELPKEETPYYDFIRYQNDKRFINAENLSEVIPMGYDPGLYDYFFLIIDAVLTNPYPINLLEQFPISICTVGAFRNWNHADRAALSDFQEILHQRPRLLLNAVEPDFMQNVLGDIDKRRSWIRRFVKRILTLQLRKQKLKRSFN